jgi:hypothetical protein
MVTVTATISPTVPGVSVPVYFQSYDVDDPANPALDPNLVGPPAPNWADADLDSNPLQVADNRGTVQGHLEGLLASNSASTDANGQAQTALQVSSNPGDNYRVAASTSQTDFSDFKAYQPSDTGELRHASKTGSDGLPLPLAADEQKMLSPVLTVWRTLNILTNAMPAPPLDPTADADSAERNYIKGAVTAIALNPNELPTDISVLADPNSTTPVTLADESPDLDNSRGFGVGNGRFEHGTLCIGTIQSLPIQSNGTCTPPEVPVAGLTGNGKDSNGHEYVRRSSGLSLPARLASQSSSLALTMNVLAWDSGTNTFTLQGQIAHKDLHFFKKSTLTMGGVQFPVTDVDTKHQDPNTTVVTAPGTTLPFYLVDDDTMAAPSSFSLVSNLLQNGVDEDPSTNIFAQAYIVPRYIPSTLAPTFTRNVHYANNATGQQRIAVLKAALDPWRDTNGTAPYWIVYVQGAFQESRWADADPNSEQPHLGVTIYYPPGSNTPSPGSLVFMEAIRDEVLNRLVAPSLLDVCRSKVIAHELGHQFGLGDAPVDNAIMNQGCRSIVPYFSDLSLGKIRKGVNP